MKMIATTRRECIDWVQESLDYLPRPLAEITFRGLLEEGLLREEAGGFILLEDLDADALRRKGKAAQVRKANGMRMSRRASRSANRHHFHQNQRHHDHSDRHRSPTWKAPSYTDMIPQDDE
jgi:hypothetical protein